MKSLSEILLAFFDDEVKEIRGVIKKAKNIPLDTRLTENTRTVLELINHIAQIPRIDVDIYSGKCSSGDVTNKIEKELDRNTIEDVLKIFDENCFYLRNYFKDMDDKTLLEKKLRPFYEPNSPLRSWANFLPKLTSHIALHKGILWAYLKVANADVNMFTYYYGEE